ncbi:HAMP domain-containing histidine kinase [Niabella sp. W65]|nr:HAMP domain-containing histidine kinase [Niabella sp. W65]MCH7365316.1 HAMP domain-containing histidine kinase [Niabella sp. W65]
MKAYIQLIERMEDKQPGSKVATYIHRAHDQVSKLDGLINDLLDVSKIENGKLKINKSPFDMEKLLTGVIETIQYTSAQPALKIERKGPLITESINGDAFRIEQILINFFTNAIKYSPGAEKVILHTAVEKTTFI